MPLKLIEPRPGASKNYRIRGTYLGVYLDRTAGTPDKAKARKILIACKEQIESGHLTGRKELTFAQAARSYIQAGGELRFLIPIIEHFGERRSAKDITQADVDLCAAVLYPDASPATRNRQVYTPVSAILKHAKLETSIRRPKGAQGEQRIDWMTPDEAAALIASAQNVDAEFAIFLTLLLATGMRLSDALSLQCRHIDLGRNVAQVMTTKNGDPRPVHLPPSAVAALASHPRGLARSGSLFRFRKNGHLYNLMKAAKRPCGLPWVTFHTFCHTWATWMRQYGGLDTKDLAATGRWRDEKSASRYAHVETNAIARQADHLPITWGAKTRRSV